MVIGKEDEVTLATEPDEETATPTTEEQLKTLESQLGVLKSENERLQGGYKGLQKTLSERDRDLKKQADLDSRINGLQDTIELLATAIATGRATEDVDVDQKQDVIALLKRQRQEQETRRKQESEALTQQEYAQRADAVYAEAQELLKDSDDPEQLIEIRDFLIDGKIDRAQARINKFKGKTPNMVGKRETEEQRIERLAQERLRKELEDRGLLEEISAIPSAALADSRKAMQEYISGAITAEQAEKRGVKFG